ncbi:MAG: tRNA dihydrouridine(20/20a) synthase DusA [Pseudomonadota bacterium]
MQTETLEFGRDRPVFAVAPMIDWTDRHCRFFHRQLSARALLYTEMITTGAIRHGDRDKLLGFSPVEHPVALQLGGSDPADLAECARVGEAYGYDEINLNVGCPSDRVQSGRFGACLMREPELVGACVAAMKAAVRVPVTVKCRLGVDEQDIEAPLDRFVRMVIDAGVDGIWVHARKAWLDGLSPKENRTIPPLDYDRVFRLKETCPDTFIGLNGGITDLAAGAEHLANVDGIMLGRAAYQTPQILTAVDRLFFDASEDRDAVAAVRTMMDYAEDKVAAGIKLSAVTRPMIGLFHGMPGARAWRRILSSEAVKPGAGPEVIEKALAEIDLSGHGEQAARDAA